MLHNPKPRPMPRSAKLGMLGLALTVGTMLTLFTFLPGAVRKAQASRVEVNAEQIQTFACEKEEESGLDDCAARVDKDVNTWLARSGGTITIIDRQVSIAIGGTDRGRYDRGYVVTIFYRK